ncbi:MAG: M28 family peptidase [Candidatus Heimdallarchaeota archaeon]|nr:M28 family peptidase [Candidatus Heimdallarchaeota archaeon]
MKKLLFAILIGLLFLPSGSALLRQQSSIDQQAITTFIQEQLLLGPRVPGSQASLDFKEWIHDKVQDPWIIETQNFTHKGIELRNYFIHTASTPSLLIAAHYDSRARADNDDDPEKHEIPVPGANDGASGVAAILELMYKLPISIREDVGFLLFDGEDQGNGGMDGWDWIVGSSYYASQMSADEIEQTEAFILLDMIGDDDLILKKERNSDNTLTDEIWSLAADLGYSDIFVDIAGYSIIDDHIPFKNKGIDVVDIIDLNYPEWHTTKDDFDHISTENIAIVTDVVYEWIVNRLDADPTTVTTSYYTPISNFSSLYESSFQDTPVTLSILFLFPIIFVNRMAHWLKYASLQ